MSSKEIETQLERQETWEGFEVGGRVESANAQKPKGEFGGIEQWQWVGGRPWCVLWLLNY